MCSTHALYKQPLLYMTIKRLLSTFVALLACHVAFANGYQTILQGARQSGMGNVGVGYKPNASSLFFNPGAMSFLDGSTMSLGFSPVFSSITYRGLDNNTKVESESPMGTPFSAYGIWRPRKGGAPTESGAEYSRWAFGMGVFTPFGSSVKYPSDWGGQYALREISLKAIFVQPTVSFRINDVLSVGAGLDLVYGAVNLQKGLSPLTGKAYTELDGNTTALGYNLGIYARPSELISVGINYRSRVNVKLDNGTVKIHDLPDAFVGTPLFPALQTTFNSELPLPATLAFGMGFYPSKKWAVAFDVNFVQWDAYQTLAFEFADPIGGQTSIENDRHYKNSWIFNVGGEYHVNDKLTVRAGAYYDLSPVQDNYLTPETPDANALGLTAGASYQFSKHFSADVHFLYVNKQKRTNDTSLLPGDVQTGGYSGIYKASAIVPGFSLNYNF